STTTGETPANPEEGQAKPDTQLIRVVTDSLDVTIDPRGGDIVRVALPRHFAELDTPDVPFVLLDSPDHHTYIAQSGLIGANGTDIQAGRPVFNAQQRQH